MMNAKQAPYLLVSQNRHHEICLNIYLMKKLAIIRLYICIIYVINSRYLAVLIIQKIFFINTKVLYVYP